MAPTYLVDIACHWLLQEGKCAAAFQQFVAQPASPAYPDAIGIGSFGKSITVQVFATRNAFLDGLQDAFWQHPDTAMGRFRFVCAPAHVLSVEEVPANWGLLHIQPDGKPICVLNPYAPNGSEFWRFGFDDTQVYNLLSQHEPLYKACRRLRYASVLHLPSFF